MTVLHYGPLRLFLLENWQLCFIFDGFLPLKLFNVDAEDKKFLLFDSQTQSLTFTVDVVDMFKINEIRSIHLN